MRDCGEYQELISLMLDGELTEPQKTGLLRHLEQCEDCRRVYSAFKAISLSLSQEEEAPASLAGGVMDAIRGGNVVPMPAPEEGKKPARRVRWRRAAALAACLALVLAGAASLPALLGGNAAETEGSEPAVFGMMGNSTAGDAAEAAESAGEAAPEEGRVNPAGGPACTDESTMPPENAAAGENLAVSPQPSDCSRAAEVTSARVYSDGELILSLEEEEAPELASLLEYAGPYGGETPSEGGFAVSLCAGGQEYELEVYVVGGGLACSCPAGAYTAAGSADDFLETVEG